MVNIDSQLVSNLKEILPCYLDQFLDNSATIPCISYSITRNEDVAQGNVLGYSRIVARIKIWANKLEDICSYSEAIDNMMASISGGKFSRAFVGDLLNDDMLCRILDYSILLPEYYSITR